MNTEQLIDRLTNADPGWPEWKQLLSLVRSLDFESIELEYLGTYHSAGSQLTFSEPLHSITWPDWIPSYVPALLGMKSGMAEEAGGFADSFYGEPAQRGTLFSPAGNDEELGYPLIDVPPNVFPFQMNYCGALFFVNTDRAVLYPCVNDECLKELDTLEQFTRRNIDCALSQNNWYSSYAHLDLDLID